MRSIQKALNDTAAAIVRFKIKKTEIKSVYFNCRRHNLYAWVSLHPDAFVSLVKRMSVPISKITFEVTDKYVEADFKRFGAYWRTEVEIPVEQFKTLFGQQQCSIASETSEPLRIEAPKQLRLTHETAGAK